MTLEGNAKYSGLWSALRTVLVYVVPVALVLNWVLNPTWQVTRSECISFGGGTYDIPAFGFPFISSMAGCTGECAGADYKLASYILMGANGAIMLLLSFLLYFFLRKKIKLNLWQSVVWCFLVYGSFGMFFINEMDFIQCGPFGYDEIKEIDFRFNIYGLLVGIGFLVYYGNLYLFLLCPLVAVLVFRDHKQRDPQAKGWWMVFYTYWSLFFFLVLLFEWYLLKNEDQMITSSGDSTFRQHWISIVIGYTLVIVLFAFSRNLLMRKKRFGVLYAIGFALVALVVTAKNQHCIVYGANGERFVEFYTPFFEADNIGCLTKSWDNPNEELGGEYAEKNIFSVKTIGNRIVFERPLVGDYTITKQVLFWRFDFPEEW